MFSKYKFTGTQQLTYGLEMKTVREILKSNSNKKDYEERDRTMKTLS